MVFLDGALTGSAARGAISHPRGDSVRRVEKCSSEQADHCRNRPPSIMSCSFHRFPNCALPKLRVAQTENGFRHYIVTRHSLQAGSCKTGCSSAGPPRTLVVLF